MSYTLFSGCSYTAGSGFTLEHKEPVLWVNQLHNRLFSHTKQLNTAIGGNSNADIFQSTIWNLLHYPIEYAIVQWTSMPRYRLELGFELYETEQHFIPNAPCIDHNLNNIQYSASYLDSVRDRFTSLAHECYEIFNLVRYVNSIIKCAELTSTTVFFVNGLAPWDLDFFVRLDNVLPNQYSPYTQKSLNTDNRSDTEIFALYNKMHTRFDSVGGIQSNYWLNLYDSMHDTCIDTANDGLHPGPESNSYYTETFSLAIAEKLRDL